MNKSYVETVRVLLESRPVNLLFTAASFREKPSLGGWNFTGCGRLESQLGLQWQNGSGDTALAWHVAMRFIPWGQMPARRFQKAPSPRLLGGALHVSGLALLQKSQGGFKI